MDEPDWLEAKRRQSGLSLTRDGVWMFGTRPVENPRVQAMFHRGVALREDGEVTLTVGRMWCYVQAAGPILFVRAVQGLDEVAGPPMLRLLGEREVRLGQGTVAGWGPDERLYLWIDDPTGTLAGDLTGRGPAICLREAHQALAMRLSGEDAPVIDLGNDRWIKVVILGAIPTAHTPVPAEPS